MNKRDNEILKGNIEACLSLFSCLQTTLGPFGSDKLIVDQSGNYLTSNDGATILNYLEIQHPVVKLLVSLAKSQDDTVGDGTTSVVLLTCLLLRNSLFYLNQSIHPQSLQIGYSIALEYSLDLIKEIQINFNLNDDEFSNSLLLKIASTSISSKVLSRYKDFFSKLGVDSILKLGLNRNQDRITVISVLGGSMLDSQMVDGVLLKYPIERCKNVNPLNQNQSFNIIVGKLQLNQLQSELHFVKLQTNNEDNRSSFENIQNQEQLLYKQKIKLLLDFNINIVISDTDIPSYLENLFIENKIEYFCITDSRELERISFALGSHFIYDIGKLNKDEITTTSMVERVSIGDSLFLKISGIKNSEAATIVLRSPTDTISDECIRSFKDMLNILSNFLHNPSFIAGGGCIYLYIANKIREKAKQLNNIKLEFAFNSFAESLETIPSILIKNAGFDSNILLSKLKILHQLNPEDNKWKGINLENGHIVDMMSEIKVIEPSFLLKNILQLSTRATQMILRINSNILIEPKVSFKPPSSN